MKQHVIVLMDNSFSMLSRARSIIDGVNKFIDSLKQRQDAVDILFSLILFSQEFIYMCKGLFVREVPKFRIEELPTFGQTHLYDAIAKVLNEWVPEKRVNHNLFIITDGMDNGSKLLGEEEAKKACEIVIEDHEWKITHCDVNLGSLDSDKVRKIIYDINNLENLLANFSI